MSRSTPPSSAKPAPKTSKPTAPANDEGLRIIKKYPNRRLYDTNSSSYITLTQVRQLVMERERFVVRDAKSGDDLTRSILLQIILEEEAGGAPVIVDLSADHRFDDAWYYGLPELTRGASAGCRSGASPSTRTSCGRPPTSGPPSNPTRSSSSSTR